MTAYRGGPTAEEVALLRQVQELARSCQDGTHLYLKFEGD